MFDGKNKEYGAYELRKTYASRVRISMAVMSSLVLLMVAGFLFAGNAKPAITRIFEIPDETIPELIENKAKPVVPPPPPPAPPPEVMERRNLNIVVVPDNQAPDETEIPPNEELENAKLSLLNRDGPVFDNITAPPVEAAIGKGIVVAPTAPNPDSTFLKVEIESRYPGGSPAWQRFLIKNLSNNYPQEAIDQGISGKVDVRFIVDREGNVSNVQAVSGPKELHEIAIKTIRKSGKWEPAQQNGNIVKSYKSQAIVFALDPQ